MRTASLLIAAILAGGIAAACSPDSPMGQRTDDAVVRADMGMARTDVALTRTSGADVPVGHFSGVELRGGGHVVLRYGTTERVTLVSGSTQFTRFHIENGHTLVIDACTYDCPSHYDLEVQIQTPRIEAVAIEGGGHIDLSTIAAAKGNAAVNGGGRIRIHADQHLTAAVNGGGSIGYSGNAEVTSAVNGGGSVRREDGGRG